MSDHDTHDYAEGTRARRWLGVIFRPPLRLAVRALLWLCPDTPIVANVHVNYQGSIISTKPGARDGMILVRMGNIRIPFSE